MLHTFAQHLTKYLNEQEIAQLIASLDAKRYQGLLLNIDKFSEENLIREFPSLIKHPIITNGYIYDPELIAPGKSYLFNAGAYYLQDLSAMLVASLITPSQDEIIADLCAAPGGKSIQTALNNPQSVLIANDISGLRAKTLAQNVERFGLSNVVVTNEDALDLIKKSTYKFDKIILDAPCSGSGMFRKSFEMLNDWSLNKVTKFQEIQKELLTLAYSKLKPGGELIYSTCSFSYEENEAVILSLLANSDAEIIPISAHESFYMSKDVPGAIHLFPHLFEGDGHFICKLRKSGQKIVQPLTKPKINTFGQYKLDLELTNHGEHYFGLKFNIKMPFNIVRFGVFLGTIEKGNISYNHHLAHYLPVSAAIALNAEEKEKYLQGETFVNLEFPDGYQVVKYQELNLGFVKVSRGNVKNHYPKGLRIR